MIYIKTIGSEDRYRYARRAGILENVDNPSGFSIRDILKRVRRNQEQLQAKFERKMKQEQAYYEDKYGPQSNLNSANKNL